MAEYQFSIRDHWRMSTLANRGGRKNRERSLARRAATRLPYPRVLIVTEGKKTEPLYFHAIKRELRRPNVHLAIVHAGYSEPLQIVERALEKFRETFEFDRVYAVFDRDEHLTYSDALRVAASYNCREKNDLDEPVPFEAIPSVPCFELWLLLHFEDIQAPLHRKEAFKRVKGHLPLYDKGYEHAYRDTQMQIAVATQRAERLRGRFRADNGADPFTTVNVLVALLRSALGVA